uniref:Uncharacterized protein n=1 Tax=Myotis myotis TaxID=51298 RepID=A0A7J7VYM1_MYOMY|nr:hypothetical protein mMyoMyo1_012306 [Myotis myotis]
MPVCNFLFLACSDSLRKGSSCWGALTSGVPAPAALAPQGAGSFFVTPDFGWDQRPPSHLNLLSPQSSIPGIPLPRPVQRYAALSFSQTQIISKNEISDNSLGHFKRQSPIIQDKGCYLLTVDLKSKSYFTWLGISVG